MKIAFSKDISRKIIWFGLLVAVFLMPLSQILSSRLLISLVLGSMVTSFNRNLSNKVFLGSWDIAIYFLVLIFGLLSLNDITVGLNKLETNLCLLAFPIILNRVGPFSESKAHKLLLIFSSGLLVACLVYLGLGIKDSIQHNTWSSNTFFNELSFFDFDPTYIAYYLVIGITHQLYILYYHKTSLHIVIHITMIIVFFVVLIVCDTSAASVGLLLVFSFFILKFILEKSERSKWITFVLVVTLIVTLFAAKEIRGPRSDEFVNDTWERFSLWKATWEAVPNYWIGVGTGGEREVLNNYFIRHGLEKFAIKEYNAHNQFIMMVMTNGFIGLAALLLLFLHPLFMAVKSNSMLTILLFFPMIVFATTEVILGRYQGVVIFGFIHQLTICMMMENTQTEASIR